MKVEIMHSNNYGLWAVQLKWLNKTVLLGPPPTPSDLTATQIGLGLFNISWLHIFFDDVTVIYSLTAVNLNATFSQNFFTQEQYYILSVPTFASCDTYSFQVVATADSGTSNSSDIIKISVLSRPDLYLVVNSMDYSLSKTKSNQFTVRIRIQVCANKLL